uniref:Coenzyme Q-binding protein COQ10 homolog B n=1 Tax=Schistocephalus solidus TaxID=70667 RepID=A0A0X3PC91_SCHSO
MQKGLFSFTSFFRSHKTVAHSVQLVSRRNFFADLFSENNRKIYQEQRLLGYTREQMFDIVSQVEHYSTFLPWCVDSQLLQESTTKGKLYRVTVGFYLFQESYDCWVTTKRPTHVKSVSITGNLFNHLINEWSFSEGLPNNLKTCTVRLLVDFNFRSKLHAQVSQIFFDQVVNTMVASFLSRAEALHGKESISRQKPKVLQCVR